MKKEREIFVKEFIEQIGHYMYEHIDPWEYEKGMQGLDDETIKDIAEGLFDDLFISNKELRKLKLKKLEL